MKTQPIGRHGTCGSHVKTAQAFFKDASALEQMRFVQGDTAARNLEKQLRIAEFIAMKKLPLEIYASMIQLHIDCGSFGTEPAAIYKGITTGMPPQVLSFIVGDSVASIRDSCIVYSTRAATTRACWQLSTTCGLRLLRNHRRYAATATAATTSVSQPRQQIWGSEATDMAQHLQRLASPKRPRRRRSRAASSDVLDRYNDHCSA